MRKRWICRKEEEKSLEEHKTRVKNAKCAVDVSPPACIKRICNAKKIMKIEERFTEIERENRILFEKILKINNKPRIFGSVSSGKITNRKVEMSKTNDFSELVKRTESNLYETSWNEKAKQNKLSAVAAEFREQSCRWTRFYSPDGTLNQDFSLKEPVFRQGKVLNNRPFLIEVYRVPEKFKVLIFSLAFPEKLFIDIAKNELPHSPTETNYKNLINRLQIIRNSVFLPPERSNSTLN